MTEMTESQQEIDRQKRLRRGALRIAEHLFYQLVHIFIRHGVLIPELKKVLEWTAARAAMLEPEFKAPGRNDKNAQSASYAAVLTGLNRIFVKKVAESDATPLPADGGRIHRTIRVLDAWRTEPGYQDGDGNPLVLPVRGNAPSLHQLCLKHGRDTTTRAIADALVRGGSAEWVIENNAADEKAHLQFKRSVVQEENFSETDIVIMTQVGTDFTHSYQQALNPKIDPQPKFIEAYFNDIDPAKRGDAAKWVRGEMDVFSRKIADGLKAFRSTDGKGVRMGVGAYSFEDAELILDKEPSDDE